MERYPDRGYILVDPGLALPQLGLSNDTQVRCLAYFMRRIRQVMSIPDGIRFELISAQYIGGPYPAIGLYSHRFVDTNENLTLLSFAIEERLEQFAKEIGMQRLMTLSAEEEVCWEDVLSAASLRSQYN